MRVVQYDLWANVICNLKKYLELSDHFCSGTEPRSQSHVAESLHKVDQIATVKALVFCCG